MVFVFDLDDTICETDSYSEEFIKSFFVENRLPYKQIAKNVRYAESKFDWDHQTALAWYKKYGDEMFLNFPAKPNAIKTINLLHDMGHTIIIATARAKDWHNEPKKFTFAWLKNNGVKYDKVYIGRIDKENICKKENADIFVDDDLEITKRVAEYFSKTGKGQAYLMTSNFNKDFEVGDNILRLNTFKELNKIIDIDNEIEIG